MRSYIGCGDEEIRVNKTRHARTMRLIHVFSLVRRCEEPRPMVEAQSRSMLIVKPTVETFRMAPQSTMPTNAANDRPVMRPSGAMGVKK